MAEAAYSIEQAANDLIEIPNDALPTAYDPGQLERDTPAEPKLHGALSVEEAADLIPDDLPAQHARAGKAVAHHNGKALTLEHLTQGFNEGLAWRELLADVHSRYELIAEASRNLHAGAGALAELLNAMSPLPNAALANTDPVAYTQAKALYDVVHSAALETVLYAQSIAQQQGQAALAQIPRDNIAFEAASFKEAFPQSTNPKWLEQFYSRIVRVAEACGFHETELHTLTDHRAFKVLDLAAKALERQQSGKQPGRAPERPKPRLVASNHDSHLSMSEAMDLDFD